MNGRKLAFFCAYSSLSISGSLLIKVEPLLAFILALAAGHFGTLFLVEQHLPGAAPKKAGDK